MAVFSYGATVAVQNVAWLDKLLSEGTFYWFFILANIV